MIQFFSPSLKIYVYESIFYLGFPIADLQSKL